MTPIRIVIADDHPIVRSGLMGLLASQDDFEIVAEASDGRELVAAVQRTRPDVVLTDLRMPALDGVGAIREMCATHPGLKVLVLTTYDTDADILRAVEAGATGYVLKETPRGAVRRDPCHGVRQVGPVAHRRVAPRGTRA
jgi:DNA-binding NarL/FixJ family response regulator